MINQTRYIAGLLFISLLLGGCAELKNYHPNNSYCTLTDPLPDKRNKCSDYTLQRYNGRSGYLLSFVEFDEQGQLFDRAQLHTVLQDLEKQDDELLMVVFVHGWHNNAAPDNDNIIAFRKTLINLAVQEDTLSKVESRNKRRIAGIYVGWRGDSISHLNIPVIHEATRYPITVAQQATFWDRKNTAHKIGHAGLTELLVRLEEIRKSRNAKHNHENTKLVVIGHSFGGAAVLSAASQILLNGFINTSCQQSSISMSDNCNINGLGNLVVLINPATEAQQFSTLHDMAIEKRDYSPSQLPVLAVISSETDFPVRKLFPLGRWFSTRFESTLDVNRLNSNTGKMEVIDQQEANLQALGQFKPYINYRLTDGACHRNALKPLDNKFTEKELALNFLKTTSPDWDDGKALIRFNGDNFNGCLMRMGNISPRNPYLVISANKAIIDGHNDILNPKLRGFIKGLVLLGNQNSSLRKRINARNNDTYIN